MVNLDEQIGARIGTRRRALGLDCERLARALHTSPVILARWEAGLERVPPESLLTLATSLDCKISHFFNGLRHGDNASDLTRIRLIGGTDLDE